MDGSPELRFSVYSTRFDEKEALGERGGDGDLTRTERGKRDAMKAARCFNETALAVKLAAALM